MFEGAEKTERWISEKTEKNEHFGSWTSSWMFKGAEAAERWIPEKAGE